MIPLVAALPIVQDVVGGVAGTVANVFTPSEPTPPATSVPFSTALSRASAPAPSANTPGILRAEQWSEMSRTDLKSWATSLTGHHIDATDTAGHAVSGTVKGIQQSGDSIALNVGGHLVSLSQLKQISWSAMTA